MKTLFKITNQEHKGLIVFCLLALFFVITLAFFQQYLASKSKLDYQLTEFEDSVFNEIKSENIQTNPQKHLIVNSSFNPNNLSENEWIAMGIPSKIATRIVKYHTKVKTFESANDLLKVYGFKNEWLIELKHFVEIPIENYSKHNTKSNESVSKSEIKVNYVKPLIDLNSATASDLEAINGIGPVLALRIIKFRDKLGGFAAENQLFEVYGLDTNTVKLKDFRVDKAFVKKININEMTFKEMVAHPYIGYENAKILAPYVKNHPIKSYQDILNVRELSEKCKAKLKGYF